MLIIIFRFLFLTAATTIVFITFPKLWIPTVEYFIISCLIYLFCQRPKKPINDPSFLCCLLSLNLEIAERKQRPWCEHPLEVKCPQCQEWTPNCIHWHRGVSPLWHLPSTIRENTLWHLSTIHRGRQCDYKSRLHGYYVIRLPTHPLTDRLWPGIHACESDRSERIRCRDFSVIHLDTAQRNYSEQQQGMQNINFEMCY